MRTLFFVTLFVVSVLAFWLVLHLGRRAKRRFKSRTSPLQKASADAVQEKFHSDLSRSPAPKTGQRSDPVSPEGTARPDSDSSEFKKVSTEATHIHPTETKLPSREATPVDPRVPLAPLLTPSKANSQATEAIVSEHTEVSREAEEHQVKSVSPQSTDIGDNEVEPGLSKDSRSEAPTADTTIPISSVEIDGAAIEPTLTSVIAGEKATQTDAPMKGSLEAGLIEKELILKPPTYFPPTPPAAKPSMSDTRERASPSASRTSIDLHLRLQLVFARGGTVKTLALVPDKCQGMPSELELTGTQGKLRLTELRDDCYEPIPLAGIANALQQGIEWRWRGNNHSYRWVLGGRPLYVLAPGDEFGLYGFISIARLWLNARHTVLATASLRDDVLAALANAGCVKPEVTDDQTSGVPSGWILFRDVTPTRAVPMRDEQNILNVLCPAHEIEPHFVGGIRLERNSYLAGYPPRIRLTGKLESGFQAMIDGQQVQVADDGAFETPGWDAEGDHQLWYGDRVDTYSLRTMEEGWDIWHAHDFGIGTTICGAGIYVTDSTNRRQVRVPATNPLLIGARPGEIFYCRAHHGVRSETVLALVPFTPVWALPIDPIHADKRSSRLLLLNSLTPVSATDQANRNRDGERALRAWIAAIKHAGQKQLALARENEDGKDLWRRYRTFAKQLWRKMR